MKLGQRCNWAESSDLMRDYHDREWGVPSHDDHYLFEMLTLEGAQAGLSWSTILNKRENYRRLLDDFDPIAVASFDSERTAALLLDPGIVRNRLKVQGAVRNAQAFLEVQDEFGTFDKYLWAFVDDAPIVNRPQTTEDLPTSTPLSDEISKALKKRGFTFVGTTIIYAFLQAVGVVDDHTQSCPAGAPRF